MTIVKTDSHDGIGFTHGSARPSVGDIWNDPLKRVGIME